ncbi:hypothetical protein C0989_006732 [Termitomyces sp. Mn162]|nr:hypothetical protein C0989_006732 [Termitomyces sp. Mn162]
MALASYNEISSPHSHHQGPTTTSTNVISPDDLERRPLSICLDIPPSSSPFPSPSSSFLSPPVLGDHEFAMRPPPPGNSARKGSLVGGGNVNANGTLNGDKEEGKMSIYTEPAKSVESPPFESQAIYIPPTTAISSTVPTPMPAPQPLAANSNELIRPPATPTYSLVSTTATPYTTIPSPVPSPSTSTSTTQNNPPISNRHAPPSPATSHRLSSMSTFSTRSHTPDASTTVSRAVSIHRSPRTSASMNQLTAAETVRIQDPIPRALIRVRDFAFDKTDERFCGAGALVPRANHLAILHRKLAGLPDDDEEEEAGGSEYDEHDVDVDEVWEEMDPDPDGGNEDEEEEPLYPGLYRAMYAFEPEGTAEMALVEDQIVRVVGRGGGVGWAVVVDESTGIDGDGEPRHALVPESYLEMFRLDWENENEEKA